MTYNSPLQHSVLVRGAQIFDGTSPELITGRDVLIKNNRIVRIDKNIPAPDRAILIEAGGRTLIPGLIDAHWHSLFSTIPIARLLQIDFGYMNLVAAVANRDVLMRGFTTVRDLGGNVFALKEAADEGLIDGPRIYPSGPFISQTSGHGDFRGPNDVPGNPGAPLDYLQRIGNTLIADGVPEVMKRSREALRMGASQVKAMAGGGVSSRYDPVDVTEYTFEEMKAIVDIARTWNTYVAVHAYTDESVRHSLEAGVLSIEHGHLLQEETMKLLAEKGAWLCIQPILDDEDAVPLPDPVNRAKFIQVTAGTDHAYNLAKKYRVKIAWGTDVLFDPDLAKKQGKLLAKLKRWFTPYEALKMATYDNAQLLKLCGPRDPYPGELGVIAEGALADMLLVNGNPLENIDLVADAGTNFVMIMKDGTIYKNTLP